MKSCECGVLGPAETHEDYCSVHPSGELRERIEELEERCRALEKVYEAAKIFSGSQVLNEPFIGYSEQFANLQEALKALEEENGN